MTPASKLFHLFSAAALAAACGAVRAAPHEVAPTGFVEARQQFRAAAAGDGAARERAFAAFQALAAGHPEHPLLPAYLGATVALRGRDAWLPWNRLRAAEQGANRIEQALAQLTPAHDDALFDGTPESVELRLVAATSLLAMPAFMNRRASAMRALDAALASQAFARAAPPRRAGLLLAAARAAGEEKRGADEAALLRQALAAAPRSREADKAAQRLKELAQ